MPSSSIDVPTEPAGGSGDPKYSEQWYMTDASGGINVTGSRLFAQGNGVVVADLDSGDVPHADLAGVFLPGYDFISEPASAGDGDGRDANPNDEGDWCTSPQAPSDWHGIGTASLVAALTGNGLGMASVAPGARVLPVCVAGECTRIDPQDLAKALISGGGVKSRLLIRE